MKGLAGLMPLLLATTVGAPGTRPTAPADQLTFVKIVTEGQPRAEGAEGIECSPVSGPEGPHELCVDWRVAIGVPFDAVEAVTLERDQLPRELQNMKRRFEGLPKLPPSDPTVAYHSVLTIRFSDQAASALEAFIRQHPDDLLDLRIGQEGIDAFRFKTKRVRPALRLSFADDLTDRFRRLFAPLGTRLTVR